MKTYSPQIVANYVIDYINKQDGLSVDNLKLQKILYFILGEGLVKDPNNPIFSEAIQKWKYGPVVESVYQEFKSFGPKKIDKTSAMVVKDESAFLGYKVEQFDESYIDDECTRELIKSVINKKARKTGGELIDETHRHEPWKKFQSEIESGRQNLEYTNAEIKKWFEENEK
ncbi:conserved hypothetical protein [Brochothrix thermosphacta]|uniref:Panacea domain-containing protein n=1 Tax=Brochothrix thermosphacta TaxID=2756 RepID=UPI000D2C24F9|nr:type II toxin-antitoxin system antitoxin SocA domain-containing protein [Brochothrix thermosphacta]SOC27451.1 conserved hypothetical protein [Brochothrix thermosphacta]